MSTLLTFLQNVSTIDQWWAIKGFYMQFYIVMDCNACLSYEIYLTNEENYIKPDVSHNIVHIQKTGDFITSIIT